MALAKIGLEAVLDLAGWKKGTKAYTEDVDQMTEKTGRFSTILSGAGKVVGVASKAIAGAAAAGIGALGTGLGLALKEAMGAQEAMIALEQVIASTGGAAGITANDAAALAGSLQLVTRFSDEEVMAAETMLLQFETMNKETFPEATRLALDLAQRLGTGPAEAARMLGKALAEPGEGLLRLKQAGVTFTDAEEEMITAIFEAGDVAGAQAAIMDKLQRSIGGAATAAGSTFAGQLDILKNQFSDILEQIGGAVLPSLQQLGGELLNALGRPEVQQAIANVAGWLATNLPIAIETTATFITTQLVPAIESMVSWIKDQAIPSLTSWWKAFDDFNQKVNGIALDLHNALESVFGDFGLKEGASKDPIGDWFKNLGKNKVPDYLEGHSPPPLATWLDEIAASAARMNMSFGGFGGAVREMPAMTQARAVASTVTHSTSVGGDTIVQNINDPVSFYLAQAIVNDRKRDRWSAAMGVA